MGNESKDIQKELQDAAALEAQLKQAERQAYYDTERALQQEMHADEMAGVAQNAAAVYGNQAQIVKDIEDKISTAKTQDEAARRKENAYRYISGVGDTLSSLANLVGVANKASNQQQTYNSSRVVEKAEAERKARKLEMDQLSKRQDEMKGRLNDLKAAGTLALSQTGVKQQKEQMELLSKQRRAENEAQYKERQFAINELNAMANLVRSQSYGKGKGDGNGTVTHIGQRKYVTVMGSDGKPVQYDITKYKNFDKDYMKVLDIAIKNGTSGLTPEEIEAYNEASEAAMGKEYGLQKEWFRTHMYRQNIIDMMDKPAGKGANDNTRYP